MGEEKCEHEAWEYDEDWRENLRVESEVVLIPEHCTKCGKEAYEVWIYSCVVDRETREMLC